MEVGIKMKQAAPVHILALSTISRAGPNQIFLLTCWVQYAHLLRTAGLKQNARRRPLCQHRVRLQQRPTPRSPPGARDPGSSKGGIEHPASCFPAPAAAAPTAYHNGLVYLIISQAMQQASCSWPAAVCKAQADDALSAGSAVTAHPSMEASERACMRSSQRLQCTEASMFFCLRGVGGCMRLLAACGADRTHLWAAAQGARSIRPVPCFMPCTIWL